MQIVMRYGREGLPLDLPDELEITVIRKPVMPVLSDPEKAIRSALAHPVGCKSLQETVLGSRSACILICDITRPVPNGIILPILIKELMQAGLKPEAITVLVATGLHRPNEGAELREVVGSDWVMNTVRVLNHFARQDADHEDLGFVEGDIPVKLDRRFVMADLRIAVGLVEPHFMAGYSGGRKVIVPGIAHEKTIRILHSARILEHCRATNCIIEGNPLHDIQMQILQKLGPCFAVNVVIDEARHLSFVNFGAIEESHIDAIAFVRPYAEIPINRRFRTVITSAAGYPLDKTYYQTIKGMVGALEIMEEGGDLLIISACSEGIGSADYERAQAKLTGMGPEAFLEGLLRKSAAAIDEWQAEMQVRAMKKTRIYLYSDGLSADQQTLTGVRMMRSPVTTIMESVRRHGDRHVAVIPEGPYVIPVFTAR
jgi:nickel-dependent lactate racemase